MVWARHLWGRSDASLQIAHPLPATVMQAYATLHSIGLTFPCAQVNWSKCVTVARACTRSRHVPKTTPVSGVSTIFLHPVVHVSVRCPDGVWRD